MTRPYHYRFIEREYWLTRMAKESERITRPEIESMLDNMNAYWNDLTFKFYPNGAVDIIDNGTGLYLTPSQLSGACYDFYVRKRIEHIRTHLNSLQQQSA